MMNREERCKLLIEKGYTYNPETGQIFGIYGRLITRKSKDYITLVVLNNKKVYELMGHQLAWYIIYNEVVDCIDHINGDRSDNRIDNLRSVTNQQNQWNQTKAKGYCFHKATKKYISKIRINNEEKYLGVFDKEEDARQSYLDAKKKYHIIK